MEPSLNAVFKRRLVAREPMVGAFLKTPHPVVVEIMALAGYDMLVIDAEHGALDRSAVDLLVLAGRAVGMPMVVRVPTGSPDWILTVLDCGAAGIMVPHVNSAADAERLVRSSRYGPGGRGFAGTTRAAGYSGRTMADHLRMAADETVLMCQIEDPEGARAFEEIAAVDGVDMLFVGRADLAVGHGYSDFLAPESGAIARQVLGAKASATGLYTLPGEDLGPHLAAGASLFVVGSDHTAILRGSQVAEARQMLI